MIMEESMKDHGKMIKGMERDLRDTVMGIYMKECLSEEKLMEKEYTNGKTENCMKENGLMG